MAIGKNPYDVLMSDPHWGEQCRIIQELPEASISVPFLVGGSVRDIILNRPINDLDLATSIPDSARDLASAFARKTGRRLVEYTHGQTIYRVAAPGLKQVDFTDPVGGNTDSDLSRRDFTINAMAVGLIGDMKGVFLDPTRGKTDLDKKIIRATDPTVFLDDPLRMLRAFRFNGELGFEIEPETLGAIKANVHLLRKVAGERIQLELLATLNPEGSVERVLNMDMAGLLGILLPELKMQKNVGQNAYHHLDVWEHTLETIREFERILRLDLDYFAPYHDRLVEYVDFIYPSGHSRKSLMKLAMLTHDIAKPHCRGIRDDGRITFIGHERLGSEMMNEHMTRMKFPGYEREFVRMLIMGHLRPAMFSHDDIRKPRSAYRFFNQFEDASLGIILISLADRAGAQGELVTDRVNMKHDEAAKYLFECLFDKTDIVIRPPQLIDGGRLMHELGIQPGPIIGHLLAQVTEAQVMGEVTTPDEAIAFCRGIVEDS